MSTNAGLSMKHVHSCIPNQIVCVYLIIAHWVMLHVILRVHNAIAIFLEVHALSGCIKIDFVACDTISFCCMN